MTVRDSFEELRKHISGEDLLTVGYAQDLLRVLETAFFQDGNRIEVWMSDNKKIYFGAGTEDLDSLIVQHIKAEIDKHERNCHYKGDSPAV